MYICLKHTDTVFFISVPFITNGTSVYVLWVSIKGKKYMFNYLTLDLLSLPIQYTSNTPCLACTMFCGNRFLNILDDN